MKFHTELVEEAATECLLVSERHNVYTDRRVNAIKISVGQNLRDKIETSGMAESLIIGEELVVTDGNGTAQQSG